MRSPRTVYESNQQQNNSDFYRAIQEVIGEVVSVADSGAAAGVEFSVDHGLGRPPLYVQLLVNENQTDAYLSIRPGATAWTKEKVYLDCSEANAALKIRIT